VDSAQREALAKYALARSAADQLEVRVSSSDDALTRFSRGISNQNVASQNTSIAVRAIVDGRTGVAASNDCSESSIDALVARAQQMATFAPKDPQLPTLPSGSTAPAPEGAYAQATSLAAPETRAGFVDAIVRRAEAQGFWTSGYAATSSGGTTIVNSSGALASFDGTDAAINAKATAPDSTGFAEQYANDVTSLDGDAVGARAVELARASAKPRGVDPGTWTVILDPPAFGELFSYLVGHFSAQSFNDGSSFCSGALDTSFFDESVDVTDDYAHPLAPSMPFDHEGQPKLRVPLVEAGVVRGIVTDSYYARKLDRANTGHALPAPNAWGPQPLNIVIGGGAKSRDELIAETKRGLLVSRFWYIRTVDQKRAIVTGMTRDGTFLIENGKIAGGVRNMRFNQSIIDALKSVEFSNERRRTGQYSYSLVVPTAKIAAFTFTSTTEF
jgi:PmbA protein